jgi:hypothetical protein
MLPGGGQKGRLPLVGHERIRVAGMAAAALQHSAHYASLGFRTLLFNGAERARRRLA